MALIKGFWLRPTGVAVMVLVLAGCVASHHATTGKLDRRAADLKVLLMPPDITLAELTAGGVLEPNAEWTAAAKTHVNSALTEFIQQRKARLVEYVEPVNDSQRHRLHSQLVKLSSALGMSIMMHQYASPLQLPTKKDKFAWSMGNTVEELGKDFGADYALFVNLQDSYASAGRVAVIVLAAIARVQVQGGQQIGFASLVDLRTGEVVWFNRLIRPSGDLRKSEAAKESIRQLMKEFPT